MAKQPASTGPSVESTALASSAKFGGDYGAGTLARQGLDAKSDDICPNPDEHYPFLDITRICCVGMVAIDHGAPAFGQWNCLFAQSWVLQYLFLVCGVCYGMSKKSLIDYELRLVGYCIIGIFVNWSAWLLKGMDWRSNFFAVVYHFWFVVGLICFTLLLAPVRAYLDRTRKRCDSERPCEEEHHDEEVAARGSTMTVTDRAVDRDSLLSALGVIGGGMLGLMILGNVVVLPFLNLLAPSFLEFVHQLGTGAKFWGLPQDGNESMQFLAQVCSYATLTATNVYLIFACPRVFHDRRLTAWFVFVNTYMNRLFWYRGKDERPWHGFDLMMIALTTYYFGLLHRRTLGKYMARYWFVLLLPCVLMWPTGLHERLDENPPFDRSLRLRWNLIEAMFVLVWLCAGERFVSSKIFTEDRLEFMNDWALIVFLVHKAVHIMLPEPLNWAVIIGIIPLCYLRRHSRA